MALAAIGFLLFAGGSPADAKYNFDVFYQLKNCNGLPNPYPPTGPVNIGGTDTTPANGKADCLEGTLAETLATDTATDQTTLLCIPGRTAITDCPAAPTAPTLGSYNFSSVINYIPNGYQINKTGVGGDGFTTELAIGPSATPELVGGGDNIVNLQAAVETGDCTSAFPVAFLFYNMQLPNNLADPRASTNIIYPRNEGKTDRFGAWDTTPGGAPDDPTDDIVDSTLPFDVADPTSQAIKDGYPSFLLDLFDPDFIPGTGDNADSALGGNDANAVPFSTNLKPVVPIALYGGLSIPTGASTDWVPLYFVQFDAGQLAAAGGQWAGDHPFAKAVASLGMPNVAVLNDPTAVKASVSTIKDFCSTVKSSNVLLGTGGSGNARFKTPTTAGTYLYQNWTLSLRDNDDDGRENGFDTCPTTADGPGIGGFTTFDDDADGLYNSCDPLPASPAVADVDGDGFTNRQDNCPQSANGLTGANPPNDGQKDSELTVVKYSDSAKDGGPKTDAIGDQCETDDLTSMLPGTGHFQIRGQVTAKCIAGTDADKDGYCAGDKDTAGRDTAGACADKVDSDADGNNINDGCPPWGRAEYGTMCAVGNDTDDDGDNVVNDGCPAVGPAEAGGSNGQVKHNAWTGGPTAINTDEDDQVCTTSSCTAFVSLAAAAKSDFQETFMGTDAARRCAATSTKNDEAVDSWSFDLNDDKVADLGDILSYIPVFGSVGTARYDQNQDGVSDLSDILSFIPVFGKICAPDPPTGP